MSKRTTSTTGEGLGAQVVRGLGQMRDALKDGVPLERYTARTVGALSIEPPAYTADQVRALRDDLRASQAVFARVLGVSAATIRNWEQGRSDPPPWAGRLLETIRSDPAPWHDLLARAASA